MESVDQRPGDWLNMVRRMRFNGLVPGVAGRILKCVAFELASYAEYENGSQVRPGLARIAVDCEIDYRTAKRCLAAIRDLGLIRLVRSGARRGYSDVYQLAMPSDILDRLPVLTPAEMDQAIEGVRDGNRRRPVAPSPGDGPGTGHNDPRTETAVRVTPVPVQTPEPEERTGNGVTRTDASTGHAVPQYGSRHAPLPRQSTETSTTTEPTDDDLRTAVTVPRARDAPKTKCDHGLKVAYRADGAPTCGACRAIARIDAKTADTQPHLRLVQGGAA